MVPQNFKAVQHKDIPKKTRRKENQKMPNFKLNYRKIFGSVTTGLMLISFLTVAINLKSVLGLPGLTLKWTANIGTQTAIGALAADLNGDGKLEIVVTGGTNVTALNGTNGSVIWTVAPGGIGLHSPFDIADLNKDGLPEIIVAAGSALALHGNNGSVYWRNTAAPADGHFLTVCDIDGYGYPTVFVNSGGGPQQGYDYITSLSYDGKILHQTLCWHPCYGGLSIGDTNFDGRFELYQGDRSIYYNPAEDPYKYGGWGVRCLDAHTLTPIWNDNTVLCSSHCPMLADVDKNGILDVIVADQGNNGLAVYYSNNGSVLTTGGKYRKGATGMPAHSQPTIYDIDGDGNLEIIDCTGSNPKIWDLYDWKLDATLPRSAGEPPKIGAVTADGKMSIILSSGGGIYIYNSAYQEVDHVTGLNGANAFTLVQDVDNDGYNELIVTSSSASGPVYCFDTPALAPTPRVRSNLQFYSEYKQGVAQYVAPAGPSVPALINEQPLHGSIGQPLNPTLSIRATDFQGDRMNITFRTNATGTWQDIISYINVTNGVYSATPTTMNMHGTTYYWGVYATDSGSGSYSWKTFKFTTYQPAPWWDERWLFRKPLVIDHTKVIANLTNFPVLIDLTDADLAAKAEEDGSDIAFTDYNGNKLDHEIELFNGTTGDLVAWVKVPILSTGTNMTIYLYYGSSASGGENASAVWDSNFLAVHHLSETSGTHYDSTAKNNDGTAFGGVNQDAAGKINGADYFDGVDDYVRLSQVFSSETQFTIEAWFYSDGTMPNPQYIVSQWSETIVNGTAVDSGAHLNIYQNSTLQLLVNQARTGVSVSLGTWYYAVGTFDGSTAKLYLNNRAPVSFAANLTWPMENMYIGDRSDHQRRFHGIIDEVRVSNIPRSAEWIMTCYNNQFNPSSFYNVLGEEQISLPEAPVVRSPNPADEAADVPISLSALSFNLVDFQGDLMNYTVITSPNIGAGGGVNVGNGTYTVPVEGLCYATDYTWSVSVTDGTDSTTMTFRFTTKQPPSSWWNYQWRYRKTIIIDHERVAEDLINFPILISITDADLALKAQNNGYDIVFTDAHENKLDHEIEYFDRAMGKLVAWVSLPTLSSTSDTIIYMYYGNPMASNQENASGVWDSNFLAVHHLSETSGTHYDSTANNNDGTPYGNLNQNVTGQIDGADYFDGVDDHVTLPQVFTSQTQFTMEAWIYAETGARYFISQWSSNNGSFIQVGATGTGIEVYINGVPQGGFSISLNTWYHIVLTFDGTACSIYRNGVNLTGKASAPPTWPSQGLYIGDRSEGSRQFHGVIDEVRLSDIARSAEWIMTCYNNQFNPSTFYTILTEEQGPSTVMRINPTNIDASLQQNYTVNVEVTYVNDLYGWEFQLDYNPAVLDLTSVSVVPGGLNEPINIFYSLVDEANGHLWWAASTTFPTTTGISYNQHAIFEMHFQTIGTGVSNLDLYETHLSDNHANPIPHTTMNGSITVLGGYPDLLITNVTILNLDCSLYKDDTYVDGTPYYYPIEVTILNNGTNIEISDPFYVRLEIYWINGSLSEGSAEMLVTGLAAGTSVTVNFTSLFHPLHTGYYQLTATADSQSNVTEANETNNMLTLDNVIVTVMGDVNGDGEVNILDGVVLSLAWAATPSDPWWNIKADVNHDGHIDILDGTRLALHWNEKR